MTGDNGMRGRFRKAALWAFGLAAILAPGHGTARAADGARVEAWAGIYRCAQGLTGARLVLTAGADGAVHGVFEFYGIPGNPPVPRGCFEVDGRLGSDGGLQLQPGAWRLRPPSYVRVALLGQEIAGQHLVGRVIGPGCSDFSLDPLPAASLRALPSACIGAIS